MHSRHPYRSHQYCSWVQGAGNRGEGLNEECDTGVVCDYRCYTLLHRIARAVRRTLVGVLGRENIAVAFPLSKGLLPLNGHAGKLYVLPREGRDEELVSTPHGDIVKGTI